MEQEDLRMKVQKKTVCGKTGPRGRRGRGNGLNGRSGIDVQLRPLVLILHL